MLSSLLILVVSCSQETVIVFKDHGTSAVKQLDAEVRLSPEDVQPILSTLLGIPIKPNAKNIEKVLREDSFGRPVATFFCQVLNPDGIGKHSSGTLKASLHNDASQNSSMHASMNLLSASLAFGVGNGRHLVLRSVGCDEGCLESTLTDMISRVGGRYTPVGQPLHGIIEIGGEELDLELLQVRLWAVELAEAVVASKKKASGVRLYSLTLVGLQALQELPAHKRLAACNITASTLDIIQDKLGLLHDGSLVSVTAYLPVVSHLTTAAGLLNWKQSAMPTRIMLENEQGTGETTVLGATGWIAIIVVLIFLGGTLAYLFGMSSTYRQDTLLFGSRKAK